MLSEREPPFVIPADGADPLTAYGLLRYMVAKCGEQRSDSGRSVIGEVAALSTGTCR